MKRVVIAAASAVGVLCASVTATAQTVGRAQSFAIVGGSGINASGAISTINGNIGSPGVITGVPANATILPPFSNLGNTSPTTDAVADLLALYLSAPMSPVGATDIGGNDFSLGGTAGHYGPGRYTNAIAGGVALISTSITLDTPGIYVFTVANQLTAAGNVILGPGVDPCTVFWRTGPGAAATGINSLLFSGTIVSDGTIALGPGAHVTGRTLTTATGPVTLAGNNFVGGCSSAFAIVPPTVSKSFAPASNGPGLSSVLTLLFSNANAVGATLTAAFVDSLPSGLVVFATPGAATTCLGGVVTAAAGGSSVTLSTGTTIPAGGSCTLSVNVTAATAGTYTNTIAAGALTTTQGSNVAASSAVLTVAPGVPTLPEWALIALSLLLAAAGVTAMRKRST